MDTVRGHSKKTIVMKICFACTRCTRWLCNGLGIQARFFRGGYLYMPRAGDTGSLPVSKTRCSVYSYMVTAHQLDMDGPQRPYLKTRHTCLILRGKRSPSSTPVVLFGMADGADTLGTPKGRPPCSPFPEIAIGTPARPYLRG